MVLKNASVVKLAHSFEMSFSSNISEFHENQVIFADIFSTECRVAFLMLFSVRLGSKKYVFKCVRSVYVVIKSYMFLFSVPPSILAIKMRTVNLGEGPLYPNLLFLWTENLMTSYDLKHDELKCK